MIQDKKTLRKCDVAFGTFLIIVSIVFFVMAFKMPILAIGRASQGPELSTAPGLLPMTVSATLCALGIILVISAWREGGRISGKDFRNAIAKVKTDESKRMALICLIIMLYAFGLLKRVHFSLATFIYLSVFMFLFKATHPVKMIIICGITAALIWFFFGRVALIPLP
ncbi:MAG: tripartite tricarboxylate transporter TctB family protein [Spirochaetia bacterium]|jgi:hypothetical protein|nr:tripartite tricarboxylate transporter TctB family protein [Spirochaetia bacterium]